MTQEQVRAAVTRILGNIAPEADLQSVDALKPLRDQLDLDSIDYLRFITGLDAELRVRVPEADYPKLATLDGCVEYLAQRVAQG